MIKKQIENTLNSIGLENDFGFPLSEYGKNYISYSICNDIKNEKKALKKVFKIYKKFKFDALLFKIDFPFSKELCFENASYTINVLNRLLDIARLKRPIFMKKSLYKIDEISMERVCFYWDLSCEKINIKELFKEILYVNEDGFSELYSSVFFIDTKKNILFNFYDNSGLEILAANQEDLFKNL